ncbi:hypothetical protein O181_027862 [Austropuccinia psidii MF-1]|uniref:Uncharacterized protein n=1 Tax=Austropuccinia psidii MF-1 TaxID=1389203 RepID=A0A9Q3CTG2_9BASI|nr:hypothetical protein [Austropuccinia psidii MF-1]
MDHLGEIDHLVKIFQLLKISESSYPTMDNVQSSYTTLFEIENIDNLTSSNFTTWKRSIISFLVMHNQKGILYEEAFSSRKETNNLNKNKPSTTLVLESYEKFAPEDEEDSTKV